MQYQYRLHTVDTQTVPTANTLTQNTSTICAFHTFCTAPYPTTAVEVSCRKEPDRTETETQTEQNGQEIRHQHTIIHRRGALVSKKTTAKHFSLNERCTL